MSRCFRPLRFGLTLVEVMLALAILSVGAMVLTTAVSRCLAVVRTGKDYYNARHILDLGELEYPILFKKTEDNQERVVNLRVGPITYPNGLTFTREAERDETYEDLYVVRTRVVWSARGKACFEDVFSYLYCTNEP